MINRNTSILAAVVVSTLALSSQVVADEMAQDSSDAQAAGHNYIGVAGQVASIKRDENNSLSSTGFRLKVGREIGSDIDPDGEYAGLIGIEAHVTVAANWGNSEKYEIRQDAAGVPQMVRAEADTDWIYGLYVRGNAPVMDGLNVYGLLGFGAVDSTIRIGGQKESVDKSGLSYGLGVEYDVNETLSIGVDYVGFDLGSKVDVHTYNAGAIYRF